MAKFIRFAELPEFFDLKNYLSVSQIGAMEWFRLLSQRCYLLQALRSREHADRDLAEAASAAFVRDIKNMRGIPVEDTDIPDFFGPHGYMQFLADEQRGVIPLTFRHVYEHASFMNGFAGPEKWIAEMIKITSENVHTSVTVDPPLFLNYLLRTDETLAGVRVDLRLPKAQLITDFKDWLSHAKAQTDQSSAKKTRYAPKYKDWARYGLLPFLDLLIWKMETGATISAEVMAQAVHVGGHRNAGNLITSTIKCFNELNMYRLRDLQNLAAKEAADRMSDAKKSKH
ncbi:hypothetical protein BK666_09125 [Pseudomonas frederiksbergensis]|uniref:Uncharacterized protein n=1 Tax=Pseudomonas frederiksbergensis TaxID=104087 RepID=A0A423K9I7_9PSED|nr:DUF6387 family protein [Pseudomonas frederiksbergensis]RON48575.1 hypothetical protein BK666_09125 [Pseudomonas frederiksbergensis]